MTEAEVFRHKFFAPTAYPGAVWRSALLERMFRQPPYRVVLIQAPAGHGKSTLLQQAKTLSEQQGALCGWLSFDDSDNDMRRFAVHLRALLATLGTRRGDQRSLTTTRRRLADTLASELARFDRPVHLFLDEFQALAAEDVIGVIRELLEKLPGTVTLHIGSRALPEIGLSRLVVNNQALILRADELRFSPDEAERFFQQTQGADLSREELATMYRQTEGWPAALQLFRLSLASPSVRSALSGTVVYKARELADYLAQNVLSLQTPRIQQFLRLTSVLRRLSAGLCDHVTGWGDSQALLLFLERSGLFLRSLDPEGCWFRYHTLFSTHLADQAQREHPEALLQVHQRAAEWCYRSGMHEEAMYHAIAARDFGLATEVMSLWADRLIVNANLATVERWADELPAEEIARRPELAVKIAWALVFLRRHAKLRPLLPILASAAAQGVDSRIVRSMLAVVVDDMPRAFEFAETMSVDDDSAEGFRAFELGAAANLCGYRALASGDLDGAHSLLLTAHAHSQRGNAPFSAGYSGAIQGIALLVQGHLGEALAHYQTALSEPRQDLDKSFAAASLAACYVHALYEADQLDTAEAVFAQFHDLISDSVLLDFLTLGYLAMARVHEARGRHTRAEEVLQEAEQLAHSAGWPRLLRAVATERMRLALIAGDVPRARAIARRMQTRRGHALPDGWMVLTEMLDGDAIGRMRLAVHGGRARESLSMLSGEISGAYRRRLNYRLIKLLVLEAIAHRICGDDVLARASLRRALQLAAPGGFVRLFLDEGETLLPLLEAELAELDAAPAAGDGDTPALLHLLTRLLKAAGRDPAAAATATGDGQLLEPLTEREKKILSYLADGASNKQMARRIFVSENTVKFHLKNIYSKLAVSTRLQAINAARQRSLLP